MIKLLSPVISLFLSVSIIAQSVAINIDGSTAAPSAMLDIKSNNKGLLISRIALTGTGDNTTIPSPATSLFIYNTATAGSGGTAVTPGYYYWTGSTWTRLITGSSAITGWSLSGNTGTNPATDFLGTADNTNFRFRINNTNAGYLANNGNVFWGLRSGNSNTSGFSNIGIGEAALFNNASGRNLVAVGDS